MSTARIALGKDGEAYVATYLKEKGFTLSVLNYKTRAGEIDIIAKKAELLAFIEVKIRRTSYFPLSELIPVSKQKKILKAALLYISSNNLTSMIYRFDAALLEISPAGGYTITYLENAFTASTHGALLY